MDSTLALAGVIADAWRTLSFLATFGVGLGGLLVMAAGGLR